MLIELHGGGFANKGAQKMLLTVIEQLGMRLSEVNFVVDACVGTREQRVSAALDEILFSRGWMGGHRYGIGLSIQKVLSKSSSITKAIKQNRTPLSSINALIDLAGFAYSDQWGTAPARDFSRLAEYYSLRGCPVILMPQALGPFTLPGIEENFRRIVDASSVIFARDRQSLDYCKRVAGESSSIEMAPDITLFSGAAEKASLSYQATTVFIVPNARMLDKGKPQWGMRYINDLRNAASAVHAAGYKPVLLVHDASGQDYKVAVEVNTGLYTPLEILQINDPWVLKNEIGKALLIVGSRYHALVAALSKSVPVVALGWSHKYESLLDDFSIPEFLVHAKEGNTALGERVEFLCDPCQNLKVRKIIFGSFTSLRERNEQMWARVSNILNETSP